MRSVVELVRMIKQTREVMDMTMQEYEELFGKYKESEEHQDDDYVVSYATKKECDKCRKNIEKKKIKIPKKYRICVNCKCYRAEVRYGYYLTYCDLSYDRTDEEDTCERWHWNKWQLVNPDTGTILPVDNYRQ